MPRREDTPGTSVLTGRVAVRPFRMLRRAEELRLPCRIVCDSIPSLPEWKEASNFATSYLAARHGRACRLGFVPASDLRPGPEPVLPSPQLDDLRLGLMPTPLDDARAWYSRVRPHAKLH